MLQKLRIGYFLGSILLLLALPLAAQPTAVVNVASFANPNLPNGNIAQGSMFTVFGTNIGPAALAQVSAFPLPTQLGGTSIKVTSGGVTVDCIMIFSIAGQVGAVLPSRAPAGEGTLSLTYNGQAGAPIPITVVAHSFGTFGINQAGSGPGVLTNAINPLSVNTIFNSARAGEMWDIWGTGLGAVQGDEAAGALPGDLPYNTQVLVGATPAQVLYRGRSGCCVGIDQVRFVVPAGITGCYVPITVIVEGVASNFTTMAISETAGACSDPATGISGAVLSQAQTSGRLRIGSVDGSRARLQFSVPGGVIGQSFTSVTDSVGASFEEFTLAQLERFSGLLNANTVGACTVYQFRNSDGTEPGDPIAGRALNAGNLSLSGPEGTRPIARDTDGFYYELLSSGFSFLRSLVSSKEPPTKGQLPGSTGYYQTGVHTVTGSGGADVGAFTTTFEVGPPLTWTNPTTSISRASPFTVQWQGGTGDRVVIFGFSAYDFEDDSGSGAAFWCAANRAAGSFTIPQAILASLPPSATVEGLPSGAFAVGSQSLQQTTFPTMDVGLTSYTDLSFNFGVGYP
jgi:uncharacterized protein (TIGR03437 family)